MLQTWLSYGVNWLLTDRVSLEYALTNRYRLRRLVPRALVSVLFLALFGLAAYFGFSGRDTVKNRLQTNRVDVISVADKAKELGVQYRNMPQVKQGIDDERLAYQCPCQSNEVPYSQFIKINWVIPNSNDDFYICQNETDSWRRPFCLNIIRSFRDMLTVSGNQGRLTSPVLLTEKSIMEAMDASMREIMNRVWYGAKITRDLVLSLMDEGPAKFPLSETLLGQIVDIFDKKINPLLDNFREAETLNSDAAIASSLAKMNITIDWLKYAEYCSPLFCDFSSSKSWYNYYLEIVALVWGVFSSGRAALLVLWTIGVWVAVKLFSFNGGNAVDLIKSFIEPQELTWSIPGIFSATKWPIRSRQFRIRGSSNIWWLQLNSKSDLETSPESCLLSLEANNVEKMPLGWTEQIVHSVSIIEPHLGLVGLSQEVSFLVSKNTASTFLAEIKPLARFRNHDDSIDVVITAYAKTHRSL